MIANVEEALRMDNGRLLLILSGIVDIEPIMGRIVLDRHPLKIELHSDLARPKDGA